MSDKRIIDLPTLQTALGNDAWLVVDVESGATYKIKKSALLGLQALETQSQEVYGAINEVRSLAEDLVSDEYDATSAYAKGDYCIYNNTLYKCTTAIGSGGEAWNASHWSATKCDDELSQLKQSLDVNDITSQFTFLNNVTWNNSWTKVYKYGNLVRCVFRFTTPGTLIYDLPIVKIPDALADKTKECVATINDAWNGQAKGCLIADKVNNEYVIVLASGSWITNASVVAAFDYLIN